MKSAWYWLTWPFKKLYTLWSHKRVEDFTLRPISLPARVISVGNITFGGTGKTPTVIWLAERLKKMNPTLKQGIHLRGYLGEMENVGGVVSDGKHILASRREAGDEAFLIAGKLLDYGIPVCVGKHKAVEGLKMIERFGLDIIILDDAFQFTSLGRDLDIVLIDATRPFGEAGFPREGVMREPLSALERADIVIITRTDLVPGGDIRGVIDRISSHVKPGTHIFLSTFKPRSIVAVKTGDVADMEILLQRRAIPLSAIGNPRAFERMIEKLGFKTVKPIRYPDHHQFTNKDITYINRQLVERGGHIVMTTEKDVVRLGRLVASIEAPVYSMRIELDIKDDEELLKIINGKVLCSAVTVEQSGDPIPDPQEEPVFAVKEDLERIASESDCSSWDTR